MKREKEVARAARRIENVREEQAQGRPPLTSPAMKVIISHNPPPLPRSRVHSHTHTHCPACCVQILDYAVLSAEDSRVLGLEASQSSKQPLSPRSFRFHGPTASHFTDGSLAEGSLGEHYSLTWAPPGAVAQAAIRDYLSPRPASAQDAGHVLGRRPPPEAPQPETGNSSQSQAAGEQGSTSTSDPAMMRTLPSRSDVRSELGSSVSTRMGSSHGYPPSRPGPLGSRRPGTGGGPGVSAW